MFGSYDGNIEEQFVVFKLCGINYCISIEKVVEIIRMEQITEVPETPDFFEGIINLRGNVVVVMDLCKKFNMPQTEISNESRIIIVESRGKQLGLIVDSVSEVLGIAQSDIKPTPTVFSELDNQAIKSIALVNEKLITVLDVGELLHEDELESIDTIDTLVS